MNDGPKIALLLLTLILPLSVLIARRPPLRTTLKLAVIWAIIFGVAALIVVQVQRLTERSGEDATSTRGDAVRVRMAADGHFWVEAQIDGVSRRMLVDSGATTTALSVGTAKAAGINVDESTFPRLINTANGQIAARTARVDRLIIGDIATSDLPVVVSQEFGSHDVLGMNFLSRLKSWKVEGRTLILTPPNTDGF